MKMDIVAGSKNDENYTPRYAVDLSYLEITTLKLCILIEELLSFKTLTMRNQN